MIKTTGAEFWRFYNDDAYWPEGAWHEDSVVKVNGQVVEDYDEHTIPNDAQVEIDGGVILLDERGDKSVNFETQFKKWRKAQDTTVLFVDCPNDKLDAIKAAIKAAGGKVK